MSGSEWDSEEDIDRGQEEPYRSDYDFSYDQENEIDEEFIKECKNGNIKKVRKMLEDYYKPSTEEYGEEALVYTDSADVINILLEHRDLFPVNSTIFLGHLLRLGYIDIFWTVFNEVENSIEDINKPEDDQLLAQAIRSGYIDVINRLLLNENIKLFENPNENMLDVAIYTKQSSLTKQKKILDLLIDYCNFNHNHKHIILGMIHYAFNTNLDIATYLIDKFELTKNSRIDGDEYFFTQLLTNMLYDPKNFSKIFDFLYNNNLLEINTEFFLEFFDKLHMHISDINFKDYYKITEILKICIENGVNVSDNLNIIFKKFYNHSIRIGNINNIKTQSAKSTLTSVIKLIISSPTFNYNSLDEEQIKYIRDTIKNDQEIIDTAYDKMKLPDELVKYILGYDTYSIPKEKIERSSRYGKRRSIKKLKRKYFKCS